MFLCVVFREWPSPVSAPCESMGCSLKIFGDNTAVVRPVPIPNTAVKHCRADGSSPIGSARVGRRHSFKKAETILFRLFYFLDND